MEMMIQAISFALLISLCFSFAEKNNVPKIHSLHIRSDITYRFSTTLVTSKVVNPDTISREAKFDVTLPNEAFITKFKLITNNETYDGEIKEKGEAKKQYEAAKNRGQSAGHIVAKPRETNMFQIMVNIAAKEKVAFELTYQELLRRKKGRYSHVIYINPGQLVDDLIIELAINESRALSLLKVPAIRNDILANDNVSDVNDIAVIERSSPKSALITYKPTIDQQRQESERGVRGQFVVEYDIERENVAGELLVVNGYFVHYFAPDKLPPLPMDIVFILDKSGSMSGRKIVQLKEAMKKILGDMRTDDRFTIMTFDGIIRFWKNSLVSATKQTLLEAKDFVDKIQARGSTNINDALIRGLRLLSGKSESSRAPVIIFLTDGEPTTGITNPTQILSNVRSQNEGEVPIFSLAFGRGADYKFTKKLAAQNNGLGRKIYEDSDSSLQILGFIEEISTVLLKNVTFKYLNDKVNETTLTKTNYNTVFGGSEVIISGRLADKTTQGLSTNDLPLKITGTGKDEPFICIYPLPPIKIDRDINVTKDVSTGGYFSKITEKLWAYLTVKQMLRKLDALTDKDEKQKLNDRILQLSIKYDFVTPLTSMVVTMPDELKAKPRLVEDDVTSDDSRMMRNNFGSAGMPGSAVQFSMHKPARLLAPGSFHSGPLSMHMTLQRSFPATRYHTTTVGLFTITKQITIPTTTMPTTATMPTTITTTTTMPTTTTTTTTTQKPATTHQQASSSKITFVSIVVKIPGIISPLCMNLPPGKFILFQTTKGDEKIIVHAGPTRDGVTPVVRVIHTKPGAIREEVFPKPRLGNATTLMQIRNNNINTEVIQIVENSYSRLQLYIKLPSSTPDDIDGILRVFKGMTGRRELQGKTKNGNLMAKLQLRKKGSVDIVVRAIGARMEVFTPMCWIVNNNLMKSLNLLKYQL